MVVSPGRVFQLSRARPVAGTAALEFLCNRPGFGGLQIVNHFGLTKWLQRALREKSRNYSWPWQKGPLCLPKVIFCLAQDAELEVWEKPGERKLLGVRSAN